MESSNAYELADELERFESFNGDIFFGTCAITLRQQADRIAELEKECSDWEKAFIKAIQENHVIK